MVIIQLDSEQLDVVIQNNVRKVLNETATKTERATENHDYPMDIKQAAEYLGVTVPTMYSKVAKCELPHSKRGNKLYFFKSELQNYIKEGRVSTSQEIEAKAQAYLSKNKKG